MALIDNTSQYTSDDNHFVHIKTSKTSSAEERQRFINEALFLSRVKHPHIVKFIDCGIDTNGRFVIATEKLSALSKRNNGSSVDNRPNGNDLISALNSLDFLSFLGLAHGDIKPEHILIDSNQNCVLIDFAQVFSLSNDVLIGTSAYLAPELFWNYGYSIQSDLFSLGLAFIGLHFQSKTVTELIDKYGSSLKPWNAQDLQIMKSSIDDSRVLAACLKKMISYSPLDRQKSGKEIAQVLIECGETNWSLEQYDAQIIKSLSHYISRTHWIAHGNLIFKKTPDSTIRIKRCHQKCISSFTHNFDIIKKFTPHRDIQSPELYFGSIGISICRDKYFRGQIPRVFPTLVTIPSSLDIRNFFTKDPDLESLELNYDFHICYFNQKPKQTTYSIKATNVLSILEQLKELALSRCYAEGLEIILKLLQNADVDKDLSLILLSNQAYFLACMGEISKAKDIFDSISAKDIQSASLIALAEYYSSCGSYSLLIGNTKLALRNLKMAEETMENSEGTTDLSKAVLYNRIASVKWLTKGTEAAIIFNDKALHFATILNKDEIIVPILLNRCMYLGDSSDLVAEQVTQSILHKKMTNVNSLPLVITYLFNFAAFCLRTDAYERGLLSLNRALALAQPFKGSLADLPHLLCLLGTAYLRTNDMRRASTAWEQSARKLMDIGNIYASAKCIQNLAEINLLSDKSRSALRYLRLANRLFAKTGHDLGCCDTELLRMWYDDPETFNFDENRKLLKKCQEMRHVSGEYHTHWLLAINCLKSRKWGHFKESFEEMTRLAKKMSSQIVLDDLRLLDSVYTQARQSIKMEEIDNSKDLFLKLLKRRAAISFREQRQDLSRLFNGGQNIFDDKQTLKLLINELEIEGRFMKSEKSNKDNAAVKNDKNDSILMRFEVIRKIAGLVDQSKNVDEYVSKVLDLTVEILNASRGAIFITSKFSEAIEVLGTSGCKSEDISDIKNISRSLLHHALGGNSIFIRNTASESNYEQLQSLIAKNIKSAICIPLKKDNEVFGAIYVDSLHFTTLFEELDKTFLNTFGALIAGGISTSYRLQKINADYQNALKQGSEIGLRSFEGLLLPSAEMQDIYKTIFKIAKINFPVLLLGQTGSGKDVLARMIHENSEMKSGKFVAINCSAIPTEHLESELFGVAGKAFTNVSERQGKIELADGGSLFLDEIAEMPPNLQAKLLRVIETQEVEPVGGSGASKKIIFRLISATNKNIKELVSEGKFREDLYHRINDLVIIIPDLAKRPKDIEVLVHHYYSFFQNKLNVKCSPLSERVMNSLLKYHWPGGIRELSKVVSNLVAFSDGSLSSLDGIPKIVREAVVEIAQNNDFLNIAQGAMNKEQLLTTLRKTNYNIREAARVIQVPESTLRYHMKKLNIEPAPKRLRA